MKRSFLSIIIGSSMLCSCLPYQDHCSQNNLAEIKSEKIDPALAQGSQHNLAAQTAQEMLMDIESSAYMIKLTEHRDVQYLATMTFRDMLMAKHELIKIAKAKKWLLPQTLTKQQQQILAHLDQLQEEERNHFYAKLINKQYAKTMKSFEALTTDNDGHLAQFGSTKMQLFQGHTAEAKHVLKIMELIRGDKGNRPLEISQDEATAE